MSAYASVEDYREDTADGDTPEGRVRAVLAQQSAKLRAELGIDEGRVLTGDAASLARLLVTDAAAKQLIRAQTGGISGISGVTQASFSANGFQESYTVANPTGSAYFDRATLRALKKLLGVSQRIGMVCPSYGGQPC